MIAATPETPASNLPGSTLGIIWTFDELQALLRDRAEQLKISRVDLDRICGLTGGHASKLLSPRPIKRISNITLPFMLAGLAIKLVAVDDAEAREKLLQKHQKRREGCTMHAAAVHTMFSKRFIRKIARAGGLASRKYMPKRKATALGRKAAQVRWARERQKTGR